MKAQQPTIPTTDCAEWGLHNALVLGIAVDFGYKSDHTAIVLAGAFALPGQQPIVAITSLKQFPLETPTTEIIAAIVEARQTHRSPRVPTITLVDSTNNITFFQQVCDAGIDPIGMVFTGSSRHATAPKYTRVGTRKHAREYSVSRTLLLDELGAGMATRNLVITNTTDSHILRAELENLEMVVTESRRVVYRTKQGHHDDLAIATAMAFWGITQAVLLKSKFHGVRPHRAEGSAPRISSKGWT